MLEYRILRSLDVTAGGRPLDLGAPRQRRILAAPLIRGHARPGLYGEALALRRGPVLTGQQNLAPAEVDERRLATGRDGDAGAARREGRAMLAEMGIRELAHHVGSTVAPAETRP